MNYSYDANGNLASTSAGQSFSWDVFNRMTSATGSGGTATYTYNGDGLKIRRIGPDGTTRYYHDGIRPIWEADGAGSMTAQLDRDIFGNLLSRKEPIGTRRYYHFDGLGSTTALSDEGGTAVATLLYDAWGNQRAATGATVPNYRFTGAELDTASGLYHMGARFYDPAIGRWLSEDPKVGSAFDVSSLNFYTYVTNNPLILVDADGRTACLAVTGQDFGDCAGGSPTIYIASAQFRSTTATRIGLYLIPALAGGLTAVLLARAGLPGWAAGIAAGAVAFAVKSFMESRGLKDLPVGWTVRVTVHAFYNEDGTVTIRTTTFIYDESGKLVGTSTKTTTCQQGDAGCPSD